ncbi:MAG: lamin tail domain-containing protein [Acidimicrobiia bacterium]|nr:lamin tail domain-containing protein [Acidimicrobiia bacterium]
MRITAAVVGLALLAGACTDGGEPAATSIPPSTAATTSPATTGAVTTGPVTTNPVTTSAVGLPDLVPPIEGDRIPVTVETVTDGDSLVVATPNGTEEVRLEGINAPEARDECFGDRAREALVALLRDADVALVRVGTDQFGRTRGYLIADDALVNLAQVVGGSAIATSFAHQALESFLAAEEEAFSRGRGLWAADACGPPTEARVAVARIEEDPPGPDGDRLVDEWVRLVNDGDGVDIGGWTLRDESSTHRYTFEPDTIVPADGGIVVRTGCGTDTAAELHWCAAGPVWSNGGDMALLLDRSGNVVDRYRYGG